LCDCIWHLIHSRRSNWVFFSSSSIRLLLVPSRFILLDAIQSMKWTQLDGVVPLFFCRIHTHTHREREREMIVPTFSQAREQGQGFVNKHVLPAYQTPVGLRAQTHVLPISSQPLATSLHTCLHRPCRSFCVRVRVAFNDMDSQNFSRGLSGTLPRGPRRGDVLENRINSNCQSTVPQPAAC